MMVPDALKQNKRDKQHVFLLIRPKPFPAVSLALLLTCFGSESPSWVEVRLVHVICDIARIARRYATTSKYIDVS